jgi:hypothetical protein
MARKIHPKTAIEAALRHAEQKGWTVEPSNSHAHAWGRIKCPYNDKDCRCGEFCISSVWGTPKSPENHAKQICRVVDHCVHQRGGSEDETNERV